MTVHRRVSTPAKDIPANLPWASWPFAVAAASWTAGIECWAAMMHAWLEAGACLSQTFISSPADHVDDPLVHLALNEVRACGDAIAEAQIESLESWRHVS